VRLLKEPSLSSEPLTKSIDIHAPVRAFSGKTETALRQEVEELLIKLDQQTVPITDTAVVAETKLMTEPSPTISQSLTTEPTIILTRDFSKAERALRQEVEEMLLKQAELTTRLDQALDIINSTQLETKAVEYPPVQAYVVSQAPAQDFSETEKALRQEIEELKLERDQLLNRLEPIAQQELTTAVKDERLIELDSEPTRYTLQAENWSKLEKSLRNEIEELIMSQKVASQTLAVSEAVSEVQSSAPLLTAAAEDDDGTIQVLKEQIEQLQLENNNKQHRIDQLLAEADARAFEMIRTEAALRNQIEELLDNQNAVETSRGHVLTDSSVVDEADTNVNAAPPVASTASNGLVEKALRLELEEYLVKTSELEGTRQTVKKLQDELAQATERVAELKKYETDALKYQQQVRDNEREIGILQDKLCAFADQFNQQAVEFQNAVRATRRQSSTSENDVGKLMSEIALLKMQLEE
jgi:hypothetical protein